MLCKCAANVIQSYFIIDWSRQNNTSIMVTSCLLHIPMNNGMRQMILWIWRLRFTPEIIPPKTQTPGAALATGCLTGMNPPK
jgi:hypothetical protein